jgi:hypothetical protein
MIHFSLICADGHQFDGWFNSSTDFERQLKKGVVLCPVCGSPKVEKSLMAPNVATSDRQPAEEPRVQPPAVPERASFATAPHQMALRATLRRMREVVTSNAEYVGERFPEEARRIHYEESEARGIYGEASREDAESLAEEGIEVFPLPTLPEDQN